MQVETRSHPRFNHVALTVPAGLLDARGRDEILRFHGEVFGWTEMPTLTRDRELFVLRAWSHEQFVFLAASDSPLRGDGTEHFGLSVATRGELDAMWERASKLAASDPRVELTGCKTDDYKVLQLHSFYVRFLLPVRIEVQCYEWAPGFDDQRMA